MFEEFSITLIICHIFLTSFNDIPESSEENFFKMSVFLSFQRKLAASLTLLYSTEQDL